MCALPATKRVNAQSGSAPEILATSHLELIAATANDLLTDSEPKDFLNRLFHRLKDLCRIEVCFSYWVEGGRLKLAFCTGVPEEVCREIEWLDFGQAVCGTVAEEKRRITAEDIQNTSNAATALVRSLGIQAYCCHPLIADGNILGTLSFGTRCRPIFTDEEVSLMQAVSNQVALATERFLQRRRLAEQNEELKRANERLQQFAFAVSHDLKEPVRTVRSYSQLLERRLAPKLAPDEGELLGFVSNAATRLNCFIESLLTFVNVDGRQRGNVEPVDGNVVISDALFVCKALLEEASAEVTVEILPPAVLVDGLQLAQVFQNLISNAVKYRKRTDSPKIRVSASVVKDTAFFAVEDNGQGIDPSQNEKVFEAFSRLHGHEIPGTGLGLAISKRIVERHGGRMWVESTPGEGSTFQFSLPVAPQRGDDAR